MDSLNIITAAKARGRVRPYIKITSATKHPYCSVCGHKSIEHGLATDYTDNQGNPYIHITCDKIAVTDRF